MSKQTAKPGHSKPVFDQLLAESDRFRRFIFASYVRGERPDRIGAGGLSPPVDRRLARFLIERGAAGSLAMTHQDIAMELGTAREVVSRLLKHFETDGLVQLERRRIVVTDPAEVVRSPAVFVILSQTDEPHHVRFAP